MKGIMSYYLDGKHVETRVFSSFASRKEWMKRVNDTVGIANHYKLAFIIAPEASMDEYIIKETIETVIQDGSYNYDSKGTFTADCEKPSCFYQSTSIGDYSNKGEES